MTDDLFSRAADARHDGPLAERMRPATLDEVVGQPHLLGEGCLFRRLLEADRAPSLSLWGPPGTGKTTLARLVAKHTRAAFATLSAVLSGVSDLRKVLSEAKTRRDHHAERTVLFIDEIHRWSKSQQDALLDAVERGLVTLIGATTENPSFELNGALLSRCRVFVLRPLDADDAATLVDRALSDPTRGLGALQVTLDLEAKDRLVAASDGDARKLLTLLEIAAEDARLLEPERPHIDEKRLEEAAMHRPLLYDKKGDAHYGLISAFIKAMRGSDPDAAAYYLVRMLEAGEDPSFIGRRIVIFASEDVGLADPRALSVAVDAVQAFRMMGLPEGVLPLTQAVLYLSLAPKSNSALTTYGAARKLVRETGDLPVPARLLNAPTDLSRRLGHGRGYKYPHDHGGIVPGETHLPDAIAEKKLYVSSDHGEEHELVAARAARLERS